MRIIDIEPKRGTHDINSVKFGTPIELTERPAYWPDYRKWQQGDLFLLTSEYYEGSVGVGFSKADEYRKDLMIISLSHGKGYGLRQGTLVIERLDVVARPEGS